MKRSQPASCLNFRTGMLDGLPIALGYFSVSFAFGMLAVEKGLPLWGPICISLTSFTGTGQFVGVDLFAGGAAFLEIAFTLLIINLRYLLMSLSLSQRLSPTVGLFQRLNIAFGVTDEIYAVAMTKTSPLTFSYMMGLILCSFAGWVCGTSVGALVGTALPPSVQSALGIALYAMFIAILVPPARKERPVLIVVAVGAVMSAASPTFRCSAAVPTAGSSSSAAISSAIGAYFFPIQPKEEEEPSQKNESKGESSI